jgi:hypothetical protein
MRNAAARITAALPTPMPTFAPTPNPEPFDPMPLSHISDTIFAAVASSGSLSILTT